MSVQSWMKNQKDANDAGQKLTNSLFWLGLNTSNLSSRLSVVSGLVFLHKRESKDFLDTVVVREEHDQSVDTHTPTTSRRQTVLQASTEVLVDDLGLIVTLVLLAGLLLETETLVEGVVQLGVGVDDLLLANEGLESFAETAVLTVVLGQWRHHLGVASDEGRVDAGLFDELAHELVEHTGVGHRWRAFDAGLLQHPLEELVSLLGVQLVTWRELLPSGLLEGRDHLHAPPGRLPVDIVSLAGLSVEGSLVATGDVLHQARNKLLGGVHQVKAISVGLVELAGGELGVVGKVNAFVSELATHLIHTLQTTNDQHLQVQLRRDTHEQVHVEVVVVSDERLRSRTTSNGVHHGGFHLNEVAGIEETTNVANNLRPRNEDITRFVVHDQIKVALTETLLLILQTVVFGRNGVQARRQQHNLCREDGELTIGAVLGATPTGVTDNPDNITSPERLVLVLKGNTARAVLALAHDLHLHTLRADIVKVQLGTGATLGVNSTSNANGNIGLRLALLETLVILEELAQVIGDLELVRVGVGLLGLTELVDSRASDLEILL